MLHEYIFKCFNIFFQSNNLLCSSSICKLTRTWSKTFSLWWLEESRQCSYLLFRGQFYWMTPKKNVGMSWLTFLAYHLKIYELPVFLARPRVSREISTTLTKGTMRNKQKSFYTRTSRALPKYLKYERQLRTSQPQNGMGPFALSQQTTSFIPSAGRITNGSILPLYKPNTPPVGK